MAKALELIRAEHRALDQVLSVLEREVEGLTDDGPKPDLDLINAAIYYVRVFPDRYHHPKEEQFLFSALRRVHPACADLVARLERQHEDCARLTGTLEQALKAFDRDYPDGLAALKEATARFTEFQRGHMGLEEREVLPLALQHLRAADWQHVERAFERNSDPLFGENLASGFQALYRKITRG